MFFISFWQLYWLIFVTAKFNNFFTFCFRLWKKGYKIDFAWCWNAREMIISFDCNSSIIIFIRAIDFYELIRFHFHVEGLVFIGKSRTAWSLESENVIVKSLNQFINCTYAIELSVATKPMERTRRSGTTPIVFFFGRSNAHERAVSRIATTNEEINIYFW